MIELRIVAYVEAYDHEHDLLLLSEPHKAIVSMEVTDKADERQEAFRAKLLELGFTEEEADFRISEVCDLLTESMEIDAEVGKDG